MRSQQEAAVNNHHMKRQRQHAQQVVRVQPASELFACAESEKLRQNLFMHNHAADYRRQRDHRGRSRQPVTAVFRRREVAVDGNQITRPRRFARFGLRRVRIRADGGIGRLFGPAFRPAQIQVRRTFGRQRNRPFCRIRLMAAKIVQGGRQRNPFVRQAV